MVRRTFQLTPVFTSLPFLTSTKRQLVRAPIAC
jgi:hypothetical protein